MDSQSTYYLIGLMSGTSLDGIDLCYAQYILEDSKWSYNILATKTYAYTTSFIARIERAKESSALEITRLDNELGLFYGEQINTFINEFNISKKNINAIASHGHTIFHLPEEKITLQIGCGTNITLKTGIPTINNFRLKDVRSGGQGAPLVPIGDQLLFDENYCAFLNIGGFANISFKKKNKQIGFDICPTNFVLNKWSQKMGLPYDDKGNIASEGQIDIKLLERLNKHTRYQSKHFTSLGSEWVEENINPILEDTISPSTVLATFTEHIATQIANVINQNHLANILVTGGGAYNKHLMNRIQAQIKGQLTIPNSNLIEFKEALIFGLLGALFLRNEPNCLAEITGAPYNVVGGILHTL